MQLEVATDSVQVRRAWNYNWVSEKRERRSLKACTAFTWLFQRRQIESFDTYRSLGIDDILDSLSLARGLAQNIKSPIEGKRSKEKNSISRRQRGGMIGRNAKFQSKLKELQSRSRQSSKKDSHSWRRCLSSVGLVLFENFFSFFPFPFFSLLSRRELQEKSFGWKWIYFCFWAVLSSTKIETGSDASKRTTTTTQDRVDGGVSMQSCKSIN